ncbi:hypothetical protein [Kitasatospora sp. MAP5-34]|uniref:hypothetical protein n=1 Tax=Kitasatospora sp. MAP5-34 TaxID=3035102 RepID=UPI002474474C|nr:hypothetical protein [Kitasatospora sp. MAP5-34]MDH6580701.1 hypothetical protein [Kitasatospora sp. MAP5-34]
MSRIEIDRETVVRLYEAGKSLETIAEAVGVSAYTVSARLTEWGVPRRTRQQSGRLNPVPTPGGRPSDAPAMVHRSPWRRSERKSSRLRCTDCVDLAAERQRARARRDWPTVNACEVRLREHNEQAHPQRRKTEL